MASLNRLPIVCLALLVASIGTRPAEAGANRWTDIGPWGGAVDSLAVDPWTPTTIYATTVVGYLFKSVDAGRRWTYLGFGGPKIVFDPVTPTTIYSGAGKSTDGGATWTYGAGIRVTVYAVAIDPRNPANRFAGTFEGLYRSTDGGQTWTIVPSMTTGQFEAVVFDPRTSSTVYAGATDRIYKSIDGGNSWPLVGGSGFNSSNHLVIDPQAPDTIYAGGTGGVRKSTDGGATWSVPSLSTYISDLALDPGHPSTLYAATERSSLYKSTDGGDTWLSTVEFGAEAQAVAISVAVDPANSNVVYAGTRYFGVYKSADGGSTWDNVNVGMSTWPICDLGIGSADPARIYTGDCDGRGGSVPLFQSPDAGATWGASGGGAGRGQIGALVVDPSNPLIAYASQLYFDTYGHRNYVIKTEDGGSRWRTLRTDIYPRCMAVDPVTSTTVYVCSGSMSKSLDGGETWTGINSMGGFRLVIDPVDPATLYSAVSGGGVFKTTDGGATWFAAGNRLEPDIRDLVIAPSSPLTLYAATARGVYKTLDAGLNWAAVGPSQFVPEQLVIDSKTPETLYARVAGTVHRSTDAGATWSPLDAGLGGLPVNTIAIDPREPGVLYAGTGRGVFVFKHDEPPTADAGFDQFVKATGKVGEVTLDGSRSFDPEGDPLSLAWTWPTGQATGVRPTIRLPLGTSDVSLTVTDSAGSTATDTVQVTVCRGRNPHASGDCKPVRARP